MMNDWPFDEHASIVETRELRIVLDLHSARHTELRLVQRELLENLALLRAQAALIRLRNIRLRLAVKRREPRDAIKWKKS